MNKLKPWYLIILLLVTQTVWGQTLSAQQRKKLDNDIRYLVGQQAGFGDIAVAVVDSEGVVSQVNGSRAFPLASVFKLSLIHISEPTRPY